MDYIKTLNEFHRITNSEYNIDEYKKVITKLFYKYFKDSGLENNNNILDVKTVGSYGTKYFKPGQSDIDFMIFVEHKIEKSDMIPIIDFINSELIEEYGEIEDKGGLVEVIGFNNDYWF